ncbi:hypothetical protein EMCRGX_G017716 [Ephydatia muelleri]
MTEPSTSWNYLHGLRGVTASTHTYGTNWGYSPHRILVTNWDNGISAAFDVTVASPLNSSTITEAGMYSGAAARAAELRKHTQNDSKCAELSWKCIPLSVECYGAWGPEALKAFSQVATRLAIHGNTSKSMALTDLFGCLSHSLIRANVRAILSRSYSHLMQQFFNEEVRLCFASCLAVDVPDTQWHQAQLCPKLAASDIGSPDNIHLQQAVSHFNAQVSPQDSLTVEAVLNTPPQQKSLSLKLDTHMFQTLVSSASPANKARMLLNMHLDSEQKSAKWPSELYLTLLVICHRAHLSVRVEVGYGLSGDHINTRPADVLVQDASHNLPTFEEVCQLNNPTLRYMVEALHAPKGIVNLLASEKVPVPVATFLAGGRLIALNKDEGNPPDVRPIAVGETLRRLTGKCICAILRDKISSLFQPSQFGVACKAGAEKIVHSLRKCSEENWFGGDFVVFKVDMSNAFNMVSKQAVMDQCATYFPELLPWVSWCYGSHTSFWHPMGQINDDCLQLLLEAWYLDDGVLAGERSAVIRALHLIEDLGSHLGLYIHFSKCELFSRSGNSLFPPVVKSSVLPNLGILGAPIGDFVHCSRFIAEKCAMPKILLKALVDVSTVDLHVAILLFVCVDVTLFDEKVRLCFTSCIAVDVPDPNWQQAQLSQSFGGLGFQSLALHCSAAFIASLASSGFGSADNIHMLQAVTHFNTQVPPDESITAEEVMVNLPPQRALSSCSLLRHGGDVVARHNHLQDIFANFCHRAHLSVRVEVGYGLARDHINSRPSDVLVQGWDRGKPAAFDVTVASPLTPVTLNNASTSVGAAAYAAELRKHVANDTRCQELGWTCIPLTVETYGNWGMEAQSVFSHLASLLAIGQAIPKPKMLGDIYGHLICHW